MALSDKKIPAAESVDERASAAIRNRVKNGLLSCAAAVDVAKALGLAPLEVGRTADVLNVRLTACQIGLFGYPGHAKGWATAAASALFVPAGFEDALRAGRNEKGNLSCAKIWAAAERFSVSRMQAGYVADRLGIPIRPCQLGAF